LSNEKVKETKEKVLGWLKEEVLSPEEISDPHAFFNFGISVGGLRFHVVQNVRSVDSIFVGGNLVLPEEQSQLLREKMDEKKRQEFFSDLRLALLTNSEIGDFQIKPSPPDDIREVFVASKRVFYDALTKDRLVSAIHAVHKAVIMAVWMLESHSGIATSKTKKSNERGQYSV